MERLRPSVGLWLGIMLWAVMLATNSVPAQASAVTLTFDKLSTADGQRDLAAVCCGRVDAKWVTASSVSSGYDQPIIWLRLLPLPAGQVIEINHIPDRATLYEADAASGGWRTSRTGDMIPADGRAIPGAEAAFWLGPVPADRPARYLRIEQPSRVHFELRLSTPQAFDQDRAQRLVSRVLLLGFCLAIVLYNLILSWISRDRLFALNALTIISMVGLAAYLSGYPGAWLWPAHPAWSNRLMIASIGATIVFGGLFFSHYFATRAIIPLIPRANRVFRTGALAITATAMLASWPILHAAILAWAALFLIFLAAYCLYYAWRGDSHARLIIVPLVVVIFPGTLLTYLESATAFDWGWFNTHLLEITLALEALAFSLVLAARIRLHMVETSAAQKEMARMELQAADRFTAIQDHEQERLASELHDSLGHDLALASAQLDLLKQFPDLPEEVADRVAHSSLSIRDAIASTRKISHALHPATVQHLGLRRTLTEMFGEMERTSGIAATVAIDCDDRLLSTGEQIQLHRIAQECATNIVKHSRARHCNLSLAEHRGLVRFALNDDGCGVPDDFSAANDASLGLFTIEQRVRKLGGRLRLSNGSAKGFAIEFSFRRHMASVPEALS